MKISDYNKRLELQKKTQVSDGVGGFTNTYTTECTVWGSIWPTSSKEQLQAGQISGEITHRVRIRYRQVVRADWRIKFGNRYFSIIGPPINLKEDNQVIEFICKEVRV